MYEYNYSIANDTLNGKVDNGVLFQEVIDSPITTSLSNISTSGDVLTFHFKAVLESAWQLELDSIVANHDGISIPEVKTVSLKQSNTETGAIESTPRFSRPGMLQRLHEVEWTTSIVGGDIHDKDYQDNNTNWSSVEHYELIDGVETLMATPTQQDLDAKCIRSDYHFEPNIDFMILSGIIRQLEVPTENIYFWGLFAHTKITIPGLPIEVLGGGMNLRFNDAREPVGMRGVSASSLYKDKLDNGDGTFTVLGEGLGTNRISFIFRHPKGFKHRMNAVFEIFR